MLEQTFRWWLAVEVFGIVGLPITLVLFRSLPGRGIAFAKPLGLLLAGYLFWLALTSHVLSNRPGSIVWVLLLLIAIDALILRNRLRETRATLQERLGLILAVEAVFTIGLFTAAHIKTFIPEIQATEKPMDFMLLNTASRSTYYPPQDPWLSGFHVSYYYFGYVLQAMIGKLAAVPPAVGFNLGLASTAALAGTAAFGLGYEIVSSLRRVAFRTAVAVGVGAVLLVCLLGNLEGALEFGAANGALPNSVVSAVDVAGLKGANQSDACLIPFPCVHYPTEKSSFWWWWRATRISPDASTITEFPFFSFILGDLHPHVMAIPFVLTVFGLALSLWRSAEPLSLDTWRRAPPLLLLSAVLLGGLGFLNTWDLPTFGFLLLLLVLARNLIGRDSRRPGLTEAVGFLAPLFVLAVLLYAPFYLSFSSQAQGLDTVRNGATRPVQAFLFWGPLMALALPLPLYLLAMDATARSASRLLNAAALPAVLLLLWGLLVFIDHGGVIGDAINARGWNWFTALFFAGGLVACLLALWRAIETHAEDNELLVPVLAAMSTALLLIFGAELFFVKDVFNSRLNSVFKLYYQAWLLLAVSGAAGAFWLLEHSRVDVSQRLRTVRGAWAGVAALLLAAALLYPLGATLSRMQGTGPVTRTLDGLAYVPGTPESADLAGVEWLERNADPGERLIEAVGGSYSEAARASAWSGIPTVLGWPGHETQWGRSGSLLAQRETDVKSVYTTTSLADAMAILRKYGVTYVFVGSVERTMYPQAGLQKFEDGLQAAFVTGDTTIYRVPPDQDEAPANAGALR
ncbi:MAG TPA: DUF2298 domain-containing protein [Dehalococcoidia bacterium]|nr:DUF2298 domain-containing protein [Dehalococcoidia bacterium]